MNVNIATYFLFCNACVPTRQDLKDSIYKDDFVLVSSSDIESPFIVTLTLKCISFIHNQNNTHLRRKPKEVYKNIHK